MDQGDPHEIDSVSYDRLIRSSVGRSADALREVADDPRATRSLAKAVVIFLAGRLTPSRSRRTGQSPTGAPQFRRISERSELVTWVNLEPLILGLLNLEGTDSRSLMEAVLDNVIYLHTNRPTYMSDAMVRALVDHVPDQIQASLSDRHINELVYVLVPKLWVLRGAEGADWLRRIYAAAPRLTNRLWQGMGRYRPGHDDAETWAEEDWPARLDVVAELPPDPLPPIVEYFHSHVPPRIACKAAGRVAAAHAGPVGSVTPETAIIRHVAGSLKRHVTGEAESDIELIDWNLATSRPDVLALLLGHIDETADARELVAAAVAHELIAETRAADLLAPERLQHPQDPVWTIGEVVAAGSIRLPGGVLGSDDPWAVQSMPRLMVQVGAGEYQVQLVQASHAYGATSYAAAEIHLVAGQMPVKWHRIPESDYEVEVGIGSYGPPEVIVGLLSSDEVMEQLGDLPGTEHPFVRRLGSSLGDCILFSVHPQHAVCRTWLGVSTADEPVRIVTDLGLLDLDLEADPRLPWE